MFLKLEYSELHSMLVIKGAEDLNILPKDLFALSLPVASVLSLLTDMRSVALDGNPTEFSCGCYHISISRGAMISSDDSLCIFVDELKGEMSRPVFHCQFDGYWGAKNLLEGIRKFKSKLNIDSENIEENVKSITCTNVAMVEERYVKINHLISENLKFFPDASVDVLEFIVNFLYHGVPEVPLDVSCESVRSTFRAGYCFYFAIMLRAAFMRGTVCHAYPFSHIVWVDNDGIPYDVEGVYSGEAEKYVPIEEMGTDIVSFKHV